MPIDEQFRQAFIELAENADARTLKAMAESLSELILAKIEHADQEKRLLVSATRYCTKGDVVPLANDKLYTDPMDFYLDVVSLVKKRIHNFYCSPLNTHARKLKHYVKDCSQPVMGHIVLGGSRGNMVRVDVYKTAIDHLLERVSPEHLKELADLGYITCRPSFRESPCPSRMFISKPVPQGTPVQAVSFWMDLKAPDVADELVRSRQTNTYVHKRRRLNERKR